MLRVLYIGNKLFSHRRVKTVMETLEPLLSEFCILRTTSDKRNQFLRFIDMNYQFFRFGLMADKIIIDVYSTLAFNYALYFGILSKLFSINFILFLHGGGLPNKYEKSTKTISFLLKNAFRTIAPSNYLANYFKLKGYSVTVIPNIIDTKLYHFIERKEVRPTLLSLRGLDEIYNPFMTIKAVQQLKSKIPNIRLLILSNESESLYKEVLSFITLNNLSDNIVVQPKVPKSEWIRLNADYDIMISNPYIDNTPVSILEGMALGMCVLTTNVGGIPYLVNEKECGQVQSNDYVGLANKIMEVLESPGYANQLSLNGRLKSLEFDWTNVNKLWKEILFDEFEKKHT